MIGPHDITKSIIFGTQLIDKACKHILHIVCAHIHKHHIKHKNTGERESESEKKRAKNCVLACSMGWMAFKDMTSDKSVNVCAVCADCRYNFSCLFFPLSFLTLALSLPLSFTVCASSGVDHTETHTHTAERYIHFYKYKINYCCCPFWKRFCRDLTCWNSMFHVTKHFEEWLHILYPSLALKFCLCQAFVLILSFISLVKCTPEYEIRYCYCVFNLNWMVCANVILVSFLLLLSLSLVFCCCWF